MKAKWLLVLPAAVLVCGFILVACGGGSKDSDSHRHGNENWEHEASYAVMPSFLNNFSGRTQQLYGLVGKYEEIMKMVNCYCGCMEYEDGPHASLLRCYVANKDDTGITWTDHSGLCGICTEELAKIDEWSKAGKSPEQIVELIEDNFNPNV
jgi:hypothetical protein